ncbi:hypothetical protein T484DRAFT_1783947 [Baffinella frigidus]|nr:hypothetical protein T484DRAFT_1783947 [Cryptophyta sp. CCMP2293]
MAQPEQANSVWAVKKRLGWDKISTGTSRQIQRMSWPSIARRLPRELESVVRLVTEERGELREEVSTLKGQCGALVVERRQLEALVRGAKQDLRVMVAALNLLEERLEEETQKRGSAELRVKIAILDASASASNTPTGGGGAHRTPGTVFFFLNPLVKFYTSLVNAALLGTGGAAQRTPGTGASQRSAAPTREKSDPVGNPDRGLGFASLPAQNGPASGHGVPASGHERPASGTSGGSKATLANGSNGSSGGLPRLKAREWSAISADSQAT